MKPRRRLIRRGSIASAAMFLPYLVLLVAFGVVPVLQSLITAFFEQGRPDLTALGSAVADFRFLPAVLNVATFIAIYVPATLVVVAAMALLLDTVSRRWTIGLRLAYIVPACITGSVAILVWYFMLEPQFSPFAGLLREVGITRSQQIWAQDNLVWIFALMAFFTGAGNWIVIQYGSLQSISEEILEAARIDGANGFQQATQIKLPLIRPYLVYMGVLSFAAGLQVFVEPQLISTSVFQGLANNWSINQLSYTFAFRDSNLAGAAVLSLLLLAVCVVIALLMVFKSDMFEEEQRR